MRNKLWDWFQLVLAFFSTIGHQKGGRDSRCLLRALKLVILLWCDKLSGQGVNSLGIWVRSFSKIIISYFITYNKTILITLAPLPKLRINSFCSEGDVPFPRQQIIGECWTSSSEKINSELARNKLGFLRSMGTRDDSMPRNWFYPPPTPPGGDPNFGLCCVTISPGFLGGGNILKIVNASSVS